MDASFWQNKRVFVTGHTGFKGSWLSLWLNQLGADVHGYALEADTSPSLFKLAKLDDLTHSTIADIKNADKLTAVMQQVKPDIVFHLAAQPLVRESFTNPTETFATNVMGTVNVLEACRQCESVVAALMVTTDKCYENKEWQWGYRENEALGGHDPYSASKACTELVTQSWRLSFMGKNGEDKRRCHIATARAGNVIGGGDWAKDRLIPDLLNAIANNEDVVLRNPKAIRPWQHVLEPLSGYLMLAEKLYSEGDGWAQAWNFGPHDSDAREVSWIAQCLIDACDSSSTWQLDKLHQPHEAQQLKLDCSKARQQLGWQPVWDLNSCIEQIAAWHMAWKTGGDVRTICVDTIKAYQNAASQ